MSKMPSNFKKSAKQERMERAGNTINPPKPEMNPGWLEYYSQRIQYDAYDRILMPDTALEQLDQKLSRLSEGRLLADARYHLERPALREFTTQIKNGGNSVKMLFRPSKYAGRELPREAYTHNVPGERVEAMVDVFLESNTGRGKLQMALALTKIPQGGSWTGFVVVVWSNRRDLEYPLIQFLSEMTYNVYYAVQRIMHDRPECFVTVGERMVSAARRTTSAGRPKSRKQKRNTVKVRSIRLDLDEALRWYDDFDIDGDDSGEAEVTETKMRIEKKYHCERWGVSGHYRHLKSGKVIWVRPYEKGTKRNLPEGHYAAKDYLSE